MSTPAEICAALIALLKSSSALSYVNDANIIEVGQQKTSSFPMIVVEPVRTYEQEGEDQSAYPMVRPYMEFRIYGMAMVINEAQRAMGNGSTIKGYLDLENDIKKALDSDQTLGGTAISTVINGYTEYPDISDHPAIAAVIPVRVMFQQQRGVRT